MIDRRAFLGILAGGLLAPPFAVEARQAGEVFSDGRSGCRMGSWRFSGLTF
jgi:hypothetical protein